MEKLSFYMLTQNSEQYLKQILRLVAKICDEIIIVDSGSCDSTQSIAKQFTNKFIYRKFDDFSSQRVFALQQCTYDWVFNLDSDEVPNSELIDAILDLKNKNFLTNE